MTLDFSDSNRIMSMTSEMEIAIQSVKIVQSKMLVQQRPYVIPILLNYYYYHLISHYKHQYII